MKHQKHIILLFLVFITTSLFSVTPSASPNKSNCEIFIASAFSPNNDGINDIFKPMFYCTLHEYKFAIYDRFRGLLFYTTNQDEGWDGYNKTEKMGIGVYEYLVFYKVNPNDEQQHKYGNITLLI